MTFSVLGLKIEGEYRGRPGKCQGFGPDWERAADCSGSDDYLEDPWPELTGNEEPARGGVEGDAV